MEYKETIVKEKEMYYGGTCAASSEAPMPAYALNGDLRRRRQTLITRRDVLDRKIQVLNDLVSLFED